MVGERASFAAEGVEVRALDGALDGTLDGAVGPGRGAVIAGYAVPFDSWSEVMTDGRGRRFRERFAPGAFDRFLATGPDVRALWNHNSDFPLGRTRNGSLRVVKDGRGVRYEIDAPATSWGRDAVESIRRGDVSGTSFLFDGRGEGRDRWERPGADGVALRTVLQADLLEISPVTFPAYGASSAMVRSLDVPDFDDVSDGQVADEIEGQRAGQQVLAQRTLRLGVEIERLLMDWED